MKKIIYLLALLFLISCSDSNLLDKDIGVITGPDLRLCACCGGYFIEINEVTYRFQSIPTNTDIDFVNAEFPMLVEVGWESVSDPCMIGDEIEVYYVREILTR